MATPLTDGINALTQYANETTGKQDTTLSDAVGSLVEGYGQGYTLDDIANGALTSLEDITINSPNIATDAFRFNHFKIVRLPNVVELSNSMEFASSTIQYIEIPKLTKIVSGFYGNEKLVATVGDEQEKILRLKKIIYLGQFAFYGTSALKAYFYQPASSMSLNANAFYRAKYMTDIYVPWSEGEVANAPWGATNATIHYNTVYDANGDPIT